MALVTPATGLNPDATQIYPIVNEIFQQMTGEKEIEAVDTASLVAVGQRITNLGKTDLYLNSLSRRIGKTIDSFRAYTSQYSDLHRSQMEWGAYVQKLYAEMPDAVDDVLYDVGKMDGKSVDQWIINNPKVHQKIFDKVTPYSFFITMQTKLLREAFLSAGAMQNLISQIFGKVQNKIAFVMEELGRLCVNNFILNTKNEQHYHLVTMFNANKSAGQQTTTAKCLDNADFLRFAVNTINVVSDKMMGMSVQYNAEGLHRFTPKAKQHFYILSDFINKLQTVVAYAAFNKEEIMAHPNIKLPYWQASSTPNDANYYDTITAIKGTVSDNTGSTVEKNLNNVVAIIFDYDAMGTFREEEDVLTTPVNARAAYYNTFWHERQLWFNDLGENAVVFFLD